MPATKSVFTGVDYIRCTANDHKPYGAWEGVVEAEFLRENAAGRKPHHRWIMGYYGRVGEHCFVGRNDEGCMAQLSGALAWDRWSDIYRQSHKATRVDLQVTWPCEEDPGEYIRDQYQEVVLRKTKIGHAHSIQLTDTPEGAKMLTVGSRQSEVYGRMYDKFRESKMPEYKSCVRWEIEVKGQAARDLAAHIYDNKLEGPSIRAIVFNAWNRWGFPPFWETFEAMEGIPPVKRSRTDETKIAWLASQVAPTMKKLWEHGRLPDAIRAILREALTDEQIDDILLYMEQERED